MDESRGAPAGPGATVVTVAIVPKLGVPDAHLELSAIAAGGRGGEVATSGVRA
jgi:hypothetical protein